MNGNEDQQDIDKIWDDTFKQILEEFSDIPIEKRKHMVKITIMHSKFNDMLPLMKKISSEMELLLVIEKYYDELDEKFEKMSSKIYLGV